MNFMIEKYVLITTKQEHYWNRSFLIESITKFLNILNSYFNQHNNIIHNYAATVGLSL